MRIASTNIENEVEVEYSHSGKSGQQSTHSPDSWETKIQSLRPPRFGFEDVTAWTREIHQEIKEVRGTNETAQSVCSVRMTVSMGRPKI
ncbi:hypothetical protein MPTK2_3g14630 [Marchantia polymorpha subsp. ruderalis]